MKVIFKGLHGQGAFRSGGVNFIKGYTYDVSEEVGKKLLAAFGSAFEVIEAPKQKVVIEEAPIEGKKPTGSSKKPKDEPTKDK